MTKQRAVIYPTAQDPRWYILVFLAFYSVYAVNSPGFSRTSLQCVASIATCLGLDLFLQFLRRGPILAPVSGLITSMGVLLLCDSPFVWPYAVVGALAILSKHFLKYEGRHIFNPNNFGIVVGLLFLSPYMTVVAGRWGGSVPGMIAIVVLGVLVVWKAGRLDIAACYIGSFLAGVILRHVLTGAAVVTLAAPFTGAAFQLFTFYMITDPMTTPAKTRERCVFGLVLGLLDNVLRHLHVHNAPFFALFALCGVAPLTNALSPKEGVEGPWKTRLARIGGS